MLIKPLVRKKEELTTVEETVTLEDALKVLEDSGFRCVPILDESGKLFRGNIYKMHIYRHKSRGGDMSLPVTYLLKNATKTINIQSPFFRVFFDIKDLPYISVLDENNNFYGILTHNQLLGALSEAWNIDISSFVLTVTSSGAQGELATMSKIIAKYASISGCMTLDAKEENFVRRTLFTLPANIEMSTVDTIVDKLEKKGFPVVEIDDLQNDKIIRDNDIFTR
ncbi:CBS domain-containing protein [Lactobacillus sp. CC-MHH1034]|uniref:cyclic di-AMP binding protein CbpA n=1 Tax=Agrilactobacillus fermenti TaxID=2586909 RepID=UPI001E613BC1|nr:cyclic di-AMP binding protein CbpA [Agrilactobacillus fermenti]MCD2255955.1 CBS domain-containing protein [Agrilactobacillus fermenti]